MRAMRKRHTMMMFLTLLATVAGVLVVGCTAGGPAGTEPAVGPGQTPEATGERGVDPQLAGSEWVLSALDGESPLAGSRITLMFDGMNAAGNAGCNSYGAELLTARGGDFDLLEVARTAMDCLEPEDVMEQEDAYLEALVGSSGYRLEGDSLTLLDEAGQARLVFNRKEETAADPAELAGTHWRLATYNGEPPELRRPITLLLGESRFWGQSECRSYVGSYQATEDDIVFPAVSMLGEPCADEQLFLPESGDYQLQDGQLIVTGARGDVTGYEPVGSEDAGSLAGAEWRLLAFIGPDETPAAVQEPLPESAITAAFGDDGRLSGSAGCNSYSAAYESTENRLQITNPGLTRMFCAQPEGVMAQETQYTTWITEVTRFQVGGGLLWLEVGDDRVLLFERAS